MSVTNRLDGLASGAAIKVPCRVATTANITLSGLQTINGVTVIAGDRVLVKNQTDQTQNGIWVADTGDWDRSKDFDGNLDVVDGTIVTVNEGTVGPFSWRVTTPDPITMETSNITWEPAIFSDSDSVSFTQAGTGATTRTLQDRDREFILASDFTGFDSTGATDSTAAVQAAVVYAESLNADSPIEIRFPPGSIVDLEMVFITTGGVKLNGNGCTIVQNHDPVNSITVGGAGQYKVSAAFFIKRGAENVEITGFNFTTDDASFPALAAGFGSYFPSIGGQHCARVNIHNNLFQGGQRRALFIQAGKACRFEDNDLENNGIVLHIGYTLNIYFYDASSVTTDKYSPIAPIVSRNIFDGWDHADLTACLFLTGAIRSTVRDNKLLNMNEATVRPLMIYSNDFGPYDEDGTALDVLDAVCDGNLVTGTFSTGIEISGDSTSATSTWTNSYRMNVQVTNNSVRGTGHGIKIEAARGAKVYGNNVKVSGSALYIDKEFDDTTIDDNHLETTTSGQNLTTIYGNWDAGSSNLIFTKNKVVTPTADQYAFRSITNLIGLTMSDNYWDFNSDVAACRPIVLTLGGQSVISNNKIDMDTDTASVTIFVLGGNSNAGILDMNNNAVVASAGTGSATTKFCNPFNFKDVRIYCNDTGGQIAVEDCERAYIRDNTIILPSSNAVPGINCDNAGYAQKAFVNIHSNYVLQPSATNTPGILIGSNNDATNNTLSNVTLNRVEGNSSAELIRQTTQGVIQTLGNIIVNNGGGGTAISVTGAATNTAL